MSKYKAIIHAAKDAASKDGYDQATRAAANEFLRAEFARWSEDAPAAGEPDAQPEDQA